MKLIGYLVLGHIFIKNKQIALLWDENAKELYVKEE